MAIKHRCRIAVRHETIIYRFGEAIVSPGDMFIERDDGPLYLIKTTDDGYPEIADLGAGQYITATFLHSGGIQSVGRFDGDSG